MLSRLLSPQIRCVLLLGALALGGCDSELVDRLPSGTGTPSGAIDLSIPTVDIQPPDLSAATRPFPRIVMVDLRADQMDPTVGIPLAVRVAGRIEAVRQTQQEFESSLPSGTRVAHRYVGFPSMLVEVADADALDALAQLPDVEGVFEESVVEPTQTFTRVGPTTVGSPLELIEQPAAAARGARGQGVTVAVLDTGAFLDRSAFGSCGGGAGSVGCKISHLVDVAGDDGVQDVAANPHGTNVAGVVLNVAPDARIAALDVFSGTTSGSSFDVIKGLDWVIQNAAANNIVAVNMSLGDVNSRNTQPCMNHGYGTKIQTLTDAGVAVVAAAGNDAFKDGISAPACVPNVISVGAVTWSTGGGFSTARCTMPPYAADAVACFSNSASFLQILAPGVSIDAAGVNMTGTSQASPHVAGAVAVVKALHPSDTVAAVTTRLRSTGIQVTDSANQVTTPRLNLNNAASGCAFSFNPANVFVGGGAELSASVRVETSEGCGWSLSNSAAWLSLSAAQGTGPSTIQITAETNSAASRQATLSLTGAAVDGVPGPTVTLPVKQGGAGELPPLAVVNGGAARTSKPLVRVHVETTGDAMYVSGLPTVPKSAQFKPFAYEMTATLVGVDGVRNVYAWVRRGTAVVGPYIGSIILDRKAPKDGTVQLTPGNGEFLIGWSGFTDATSAIAQYRVYASASAAPRLCKDGEKNVNKVYEGASATLRASPVTNDVKYYMRVCAIDEVGNVSIGAGAWVMPRTDLSGPGQTTFTIGTGAALIKSRRATLNLAATDAKAPIQMCVAAAAPCKAWKPLAATLPWAFTAEGSQTLSAWFRDGYGNESGPVQASTVVDTLAPKNGTAVIVKESTGTVRVSWSGFSDGGSGIASYKVVSGVRAAPAKCDTGTVVYAGTSTETTVSGLPVGVTGFRVCAIDNAGFVSTGAVKSVTLP